MDENIIIGSFLNINRIHAIIEEIVKDKLMIQSCDTVKSFKTK